MFTKIKSFIQNLERKTSEPTFDERQQSYRRLTTAGCMFFIFLIAVPVVAYASSGHEDAMHFIKKFHPVLFSAAILFTGIIVKDFLDNYASIEGKHFLDKIPPFIIIKKIKQKNKLNMSYVWLHAVMIPSLFYAFIGITYPMFTIYPSGEPSNFYYEIEYLMGMFELIAVFIISIYLLSDTSETQYIKTKADSEKINNKNISFLGIKIDYQKISVVKALLVFVTSYIGYIGATSTVKNLSELNLYITYKGDHETKVIPYNSTELVKEYKDPGSHLYNGALMGDHLSQLLLVSAFRSHEYEKFPELPKAISYALFKGIEESLDNKNKIDKLILKHPLLEMSLGRDYQTMNKDGDIQLDLKLLKLIYNNDFEQIKRILTEQEEEIIVSHMDIVKEGKTSIAPLSSIVIKQMIIAKLLDYDIYHLQERGYDGYEPKYESAKEIIQLMAFFENAERIK